jgi:hypothetical protein
MKTIFTFLIVILVAVSAGAQTQYMTVWDFEDGKDTAVWVPFANGAGGSKMDINVVLNPSMDTINGSDSVMMFVVHANADPWVGMWSDSLEMLDGAIEISEDSHILSMMVYKTIGSPVHLKLEQSITGGPIAEIADSNDVVNAWQLLEFDFSQVIGNYYARITVFPDFPTGARTGGTTVYLDNIAMQDPTNTSVKEFDGSEMKIYPNPVDHRMAVVYPDMTGVRISNINGQEIRTLKFGHVNSKVIEVGDLKTGMYFVTALTSKGNFTMSFMKK